MTCFDLKLRRPIISDFREFGREAVYARRQVGVLAVDGVCALATVRDVCPSVRWRSQDQNVSLWRASAGDGLRSVHVPRESPRHRDLFAGREEEVVSLGPAWRRLAQQSVERQSRTRLANLCRLRSGVDWPSPRTLRHGRLGPRLGGDRLRDSMPPRSTSACRCSPGPDFAGPRGLSSCTRCSIFKAISPNSS